MSKTLIAILFLAVLQGCTTIKVPDNYTVDTYPEKGIFVASTTVPAFEEFVPFELRYHIHRVDKVKSSKKKGERPINYFYLPSGHMQEDTMFSDADGVVHAQMLDKGKYRLVGWSLSTGMSLFIHPKNTLEPIYFDIIPGQVTYIGSLNMNNSYGKNIFGTPLARGGIVTFTDETQRDLEVYSELVPHAVLPVSNQIPQTPIWLPEGMTMSDLEKVTPSQAKLKDGEDSPN